MQVRKLKLQGTFEITSKIFTDSRGHFSEIYHSRMVKDLGFQNDWVQENQSHTESEGTVRGLHFQAPPFAQTKLIRVPSGSILDVFVDIRKNSPTYGEWDSLKLSGKLCNSVYIPRGFAHGFCTLEKNTVVQYKVDNVYSRDSEGGIKWNDPDIGIEWGFGNAKLSEKDQNLPWFSDFESPF